VIPKIHSLPFSHITSEDLAGVKPALAHDNVGTDKLISELQSGRAQFWRLEADDAAGVCVTNVSETPSGRELNIWLAAGVGPHKYRDLVLETMNDYGKRLGCVRMVTQTTSSLAEYYKRTLGFHIDGVVVSKEITYG
jgi:hypothetical protein